MLSAPARPRVRARHARWLVPAVAAGGLSPLVVIAVDAASGALGPDPVRRVLLQTGRLAIVLLVASLACTPLRRLTGWTWPLRARKALGLLAFAYALLHFFTYVVLDQGLRLGAILEDIAVRPFITVGFAALVLLVPLALTSTSGAVRRLGFTAWQRLHRLAYAAGVLAVVHFVWRAKKDATDPLRYAAVLALLLGLRLAWGWRKRREARGSGVVRAPRG